MFVLVLKYQTEVKYTLNNYNQSMGPWDSYIHAFTLSMSSIKHPIGKVEACKSQGPLPVKTGYKCPCIIKI